MGENIALPTSKSLKKLKKTITLKENIEKEMLEK
jgi:hypothetical protein